VKEGVGRYINRPTFPTVYEAMKKQGELRTPKPVVRHAAE
jgi:dihydropyrimidinase